MAYAMTKCGSQDNVITYEFICDTMSDMNAIENKYRTLGTVAIVLSGESEGLEVYIAGSNREWNSLSTAGASTDTGSSLQIYICSQNEVDQGLPDVDDPTEDTIYLVPAGNTSGNLYEEYIWVDDAWEKFGAASIDLSNYATLSDISGFYTKPNGGIPAADLAETYLTSHQDISGKANSADLATVATTGSYTDLNNKPTIPTNVSSLTNDAGYLTAHQDISGLAPKANPIFTGSISMGRKSGTTATGGSIAIGLDAVATGSAGTTAIGWETKASGRSSHAEGQSTQAAGWVAHAEGLQTYAYGGASHAEGSHANGAEANTINGVVYPYGAIGYASHTEGESTIATGKNSHAEGRDTVALGANSHVGGQFNVPDNWNGWNEWVANTEYEVGDKVKKTGISSVTAYSCKTANSDEEFTESHWTVIDEKLNYVEIIGNGTNTSNRSNARALDWNGNEYLKGNLYVGCDADSINGSKVATEAFITARVPAPPVADGTYNLQVSVSSGTATYSWVAAPGSASGVSF